jgi:hypothetical protein
MNNNIREQQAYVFFDRYRDDFNASLHLEDPDMGQFADKFADWFIGANPKGVNCGKNDETFREAMRQGYAFYRSIGITSMEIISREITLLDDFHTMVSIHWQSNYMKKDGAAGNIFFKNIYFMQAQQNQLRIFAYITGDEQAALKEAGLAV